MCIFILYLFIAFQLTFCCKNTEASLCMNKVTVRLPRPNDIGIIIDVTVSNVDTLKKERLEFCIHSDGMCRLNVSESGTDIMEKAGRIIGGNFGYIEPGATEIVSLIWPTISLYNRIGSCPIIITSIDAEQKQHHIKHRIQFDTTYTTLDPSGHTLRKHKDYIDCHNFDKEYYKNCTAVCCAERYFGRRSFWNKTCERCQKVPRCTGAGVYYNPLDNTCVDWENYCTEDDIKAIKDGQFMESPEVKQQEQTVFETMDKPNGPYTVVTEQEYEASKKKNKNNSHMKFDKSKQHVKRSPKQRKNKEKKQFQPQHLPQQAAAADIAAVEGTTSPSSHETHSNWVQGLADGLLIVGVIMFLQVFATIAIYVLICFIIFLIVSWLSSRQEQCNKNQDINAVGSVTIGSDIRSPCCDSPRDSNSLSLHTRSSLMSQR